MLEQARIAVFAQGSSHQVVQICVLGLIHVLGKKSITYFPEVQADSSSPREAASLTRRSF